MGILTTTPASKIAEAFLDTINRHQDHQRQRGIEHPEVEIRAVWRDLLQNLTGKEPNPEETEILALLYEMKANPVWPMPGMEDLPGLLKERVLLSGIIPNAQFYTPLLFEAFLGKTPGALSFNESLSAWSYQQLEAKPSTRLFETCLDAIQQNQGVQSHQILYVGNDMLNDILPASKTGFRTALFAGDARSLRLRSDEAACRGLEPDTVLTDLRQLSYCIAVTD